MRAPIHVLQGQLRPVDWVGPSDCTAGPTQLNKYGQYKSCTENNANMNTNTLHQRDGGIKMFLYPGHTSQNGRHAVPF